MGDSSAPWSLVEKRVAGPDEGGAAEPDVVAGGAASAIIWHCPTCGIVLPNQDPQTHGYCSERCLGVAARSANRNMKRLEREMKRKAAELEAQVASLKQNGCYCGWRFWFPSCFGGA